MLCSLRQREERSAKRDSKNCTAVVTTIGASQFSEAKRNLSLVASFCSLLSSKVLWCSNTACSPNSPKALRNSAAFCSMMLVNGMT